MSKYKYEFGVSTGLVGPGCSEVVDLVDDWHYTEEELDGMDDSRFASALDWALENFIANEIDSWVKPIDGSREY